MADDRTNRPQLDDISITSPSTDPADDIPVPPAMSPAEIDERAQAVEAVRGTTNPSLEASGADAIPPADV